MILLVTRSDLSFAELILHSLYRVSDSEFWVNFFMVPQWDITKSNYTKLLHLGQKGVAM